MALESLAFGSKPGPLGSPAGLDPVPTKLGTLPFSFLVLRFGPCDRNLILSEAFSIAQLGVVEEYNSINMRIFDHSQENCKHPIWKFEFE